MAKHDPAAEAISKVAALKKIDDPAQLAAELKPLLASKSSYVVQRAAELAGERGVRGVLPQIVDTLKKMFHDEKLKDPGCAARFALARAAVDLEVGYEAEELMEQGTRYTAWESTWGGSVDVSVTIRGQCAIGLAAMGSRIALRCATDLLAEQDIKNPQRERNSWPARQDAARALTMIGSDGAAAVLRFKALIGDSEPNVLTECLTGVITIDPDGGLELAERFLNAAASAGRLSRDGEANGQAALLALGTSRRPAAVALMLRHERDFLHTSSQPTFFTALALTRQDAAIDYLLKHVSDGSKDLSRSAAEALEPLRLLPRVGEKLDMANAKRKG